MEEQNANKNRIIQVLRSFGIEISSIKASVGPTITLYEITPAEGVRISKIRNLEDDIALAFLPWEFVSLLQFQEKEQLVSKCQMLIHVLCL